MLASLNITNHQPLYLKANKIKYNSGDEFNKIHIRLGGLHQLMSILGSGGKLFTGSGLEELWGTVYAKKSIPKMLEGKSYAKCLRSCLLTDAALLHVLLMTETCQEKEYIQEEDNEELEVLQCDEDESEGNIFDILEDFNAEIDFEDPNDFEEQESNADGKIDRSADSFNPALSSLPNNMMYDIQQIYNNVVVSDNTTGYLDEKETESKLSELYSYIESLKVKKSLTSRTAKL